MTVDYLFFKLKTSYILLTHAHYSHELHGTVAILVDIRAVTLRKHRLDLQMFAK
jgi:hypothetical protein